MLPSFITNLLPPLLLLPFALAQAVSPATTPTLNITAITTSPDGFSILQCWRLNTTFEIASIGGISGALALPLGATANATYAVIPPRFDGGLHFAPAPQFTYFISGLAHITLPNCTDEAWIQGGKYGLVYADDTADVSTLGHVTTYPSAADTVALAVPIGEGNHVAHQVLYSGACREEELLGL